jgi:hypothetical protein
VLFPPRSYLFVEDVAEAVDMVLRKGMLLLKSISLPVCVLCCLCSYLFVEDLRRHCVAAAIHVRHLLNTLLVSCCLLRAATCL